MDGLLPEVLDLARSGEAFAATAAQRIHLFLKAAWITPTTAFWWPYLLAFFFWAGLAFRRNYRGRGILNFLRFCFPRDVYLHRSSATDVQVFFMNMFFRLPNLILTGFGSTVVASLLLGLDWNTVREYPLGPWSSLLFWVVWLLTAELGYYIGHRLYHRVPIFWEFHKVHHSAEVLTPLTLWRKHPLFDTATGFLVAIIRGFVMAGIVTAWGIDFSAVHLFTFNLYFAIYRMMGQHLRHTHIWFAWGPRLSRVFMSPAGHQIHHSTDPRHLNKNYGQVLSLWDWLFGSLYVAGEKEDLRFGLREPHGITNGVAAYVVPFRNIGRILGAGLRRPARAPGGGPPRA